VGVWVGTSTGLIRPTLALAALALAALAPAARAQAQLVLQLPASTRAAALGNSYAMASAESDAIFYHPALLNSARGIAGSVAFHGSDGRQFGVSGALEWWNGGVGFGLQTVSYGGLASTGPSAGGESVASAAYARTLLGFRIGVAGKLIDLRIRDERDETAAADIGIARSVGPVTLGVTGRNIGRDPSIDSAAVDLPTDVTLGAATGTRPVGPLDLMAAASASWRRDETWAAGGGIEVSWWPIQGRTFTGRAGYRWVEDSDVKPLTLGAGFTGDRIAIDWAFEDVENGDATHRLTIRLR
jgi:hypothetical protein